MFGVRLSEISNIMSLQYQANGPAMQKETKSDKDKSEKIPMYEHEDKTIESFLFDGGSSDKNSIKESIAEQTQHTEKAEDKYQTEEKSPGAPTGLAVDDNLHGETLEKQLEVKDSAVAQSIQAVNEAVAEKAGGTLTKMHKIIMDVISRPVSDENPENVGSALVRLTESLKESLDAIENREDFYNSDNHPEVAVGGGFVIDLICGTLSFNISHLIKERASEESSNAFLDALKGDSSKAFPSFQDVLADIGKPPTELTLQKDYFKEKEEAWAALNEVMGKPSMLDVAQKEIDAQKAMELLY
jgi:hypothetical protein